MSKSVILKVFLLHNISVFSLRNVYATSTPHTLVISFLFIAYLFPLSIREFFVIKGQETRRYIFFSFSKQYCTVSVI